MKSVSKSCFRILSFLFSNENLKKLWEIKTLLFEFFDWDLDDKSFGQIPLCALKSDHQLLYVFDTD